MAYGEINKSVGLEGIQSAGLELDAHPPLTSFLVEEMANAGVWRGVNPGWLGPYYGETPPGSLPWLPPVAWRQAYRKRWANMEVAYSSTAGGGVSFTGNYYITGTGQCPIVDNVPPFIDLSQTPPWIYGFYASTYHGSDLLTLWDRAFPVDTTQLSLHGDYSPNWTRTLTGTTDYNENRVNPLGDEDADMTLTGEHAFAGQLSRVQTRIAARTWPTFAGGLGYVERFKDAGVLWSGDPWNSLDPAVRTGDPFTVGSLDLNYGITGEDDYNGSAPNAYFGARVLGETGYEYNLSERLWSGWIYLTHEEDDGYYSTDIGGCGFSIVDTYTPARIWCKRTRFKPASGIGYFIAQGTVLRPPRQWSAYGGAEPTYRDIANVGIVSTGTTDGSVIEIGWPDTVPGLTDFATVTFPGTSTDTLSCGAIRFCILGETAAQWSARTGIDYTAVGGKGGHSSSESGFTTEGDAPVTEE